MRTLNTTTLDNMESFIIDYQKKKGKSPSFREVMKALNMSSLNLVRTYILALENSGRIERTRLGNIDMVAEAPTERSGNHAYCRFNCVRTTC